MKKGWQTVPLSKVASVVRGVSFDKGDTSDKPGDGLVPILRAGNIGDGLDLNDNLIWVSGRRVSEEQQLREHDVAIAMSSGSRDVVGKTAQLRQPWHGSVGAFCAIVRFGQKVHPRFGAHWLQSPQFTAWRLSQARGANIQNLRKSDLEVVPVPIPPLSEQERIVRILDEADALRQLRQQADRRTAEFIPALFHKMFGDADESPAHPLSAVAEVVSGVAKGRRFNGQKHVSVPYVRVANVQAGYLELSELKRIEALPEEVERLSLKKGDVLLTEGGDFDKLGRGAMLEYDLPNCIHQNHVFRVRCKSGTLLPDYFAKFLLTQPARLYFLRCAKKTSNLASINMTQLRALLVPLPPVSLQREFAARVAAVREMEAAQAQSRQRLDALFASLLDRAFKGEL